MQQIRTAAIRHQAAQQLMVIRIQTDSYRLIQVHVLQGFQNQVIDRKHVALDGKSHEQGCCGCGQLDGDFLQFAE